MKTDAILNADMATVGGWLRDGWRWWVGELAELAPASLRDRSADKSPLALVEDGRLKMLRGRYGTADKPLPADVAIPAGSGLVRQMRLPTMSTNDLRSYVTLEADRLFPMADGSLMIDAAIVERHGDRREMEVRVAAFPRDHAASAVAAAQRSGIVPQKVGLLREGTPPKIEFDFARQMRAEGVLPHQGRQRLAWWSFVALAFLVNLGLLVWRDQQSVNRLQEIVSAQIPAVTVYRAIAGRTARLDQVARTTVSRRATQDALGDLAAASAALPEGAWVQRYNWDGRTVQMAGYLRPPTDASAALGKSGRFANVRASSGDIQADIPIGQPFDITADIRRGRR